MWKKAMSYAAVFMAGTLFSGGAVFAATNYVQAQKGNSQITLNGLAVEQPPKLVYGGTTYIQLYSIEQALRQAGLGVSWDGSTFDIETFGSVSGSSSSNDLSGFTLVNYDLIDSSYNVYQVNSLFGIDGTLTSEAGQGTNYDLQEYTWQNTDGTEIVTIMFQNGNETAKDEVGLT